MLEYTRYFGKYEAIQQVIAFIETQDKIIEEINQSLLAEEPAIM